MSERKFKIVLPDIKTITKGDLDLSVLDELGEVVTYQLSGPDELPERLREADALLCNKTVLDSESLKYADKLKYIGLFATGYNNVDLDYTNAKNITVCNAGSYSTDAVAQHTFALILNHYNKISEYSAFVKNDGWKGSDTFSPFIFQMNELNGKTIGIIGFGNIGQKVAEIASVFNMKILAYSRDADKVNKIIGEKFSEYSNISWSDTDNIAKMSDIITMHCPLNEESKNMINETFLRKCKQNCYFVNTARGGVMVESDLCRALNEKWIAGAGIDVLNIEPMSEMCELQKAQNITMTPHVAWAPMETRKRLLEIVADNLKAFLEGTPKNVVK